MEEVVDLYELIEMQRASGAALLPLDLCSFMVSKIYETEKEVLEQKWRGSGAWYGNYLKARFPDRDHPELLARLLQATRWDLRELAVERDGSRLKLRCVAPHLAEDCTLLLASFIEGAMDALEYSQTRREVMRGLIVEEFSQPPQLKHDLQIERFGGLTHLEESPRLLPKNA